MGQGTPCYPGHVLQSPQKTAELPLGRRRRRFGGQFTWAFRSAPPSEVPGIKPLVASASTGGTARRRWSIRTELATGHPRRPRPPRYTHRSHCHRRLGRVRPTMVTVVARYENRKSEQNQGGDQAPTPPTILPEHFTLETVESAGERFLAFSLRASSARFLRHKLLSPQVKSSRLRKKSPQAAPSFVIETNQPRIGYRSSVQRPLSDASTFIARLSRLHSRTGRRVLPDSDRPSRLGDLLQRGLDL